MSETIDGLKQRLVGAFVILSLAIIFLPMIFDKPHEVKKVTVENIPPEPQFQTRVIDKPERPQFKMIDIDPSDQKVKTVKNSASDQGNARQKTESQALAAAKSDREDKATSKSIPASSAREKPSAQTKPRVSHLPIFKNIWMVQLGTFSQVKNAYSLRDRLREDGFDGHAKEIKIKGKNSVRVFAGPFVNRSEAEKIKKKVDKKYKVDSLIIYFEA